MQSRETQSQNYSETFGLLKLAVQQRIEDAEVAKKKAGQEIRQQIGLAVSKVEKDVLPRFIDVVDVTPKLTQTSRKKQFVQYDTQNNRLVLVSKYENQQSVGVIKDLEDAEWMQFGLPLARALDTAVHTSQQAKK